MKLPKDSSLVTGVLYQHKGSTDTQLLGGLTIGVKLFEGVPITGLTYREEGASEEKLLSGSRVAGIVCRFEESVDDRILDSSKVQGVIFQHRGAARDAEERDSANVSTTLGASQSFEQGPLNGSQIVGLIYREKTTGEDQIATGTKVAAQIINGMAIVGVIYEGPEGASIKRLTGSNITGLLFQQQNANTETILGDIVILGLIYQDKDTVLGRLANGSRNSFSLAETVILYLLPIIGVLGLLLPAVRQDTDFSPLNFLRVPWPAITALLIVLVVVPITLLIYQRYRHRRLVPE